ncbi:Arginine-glutamic acid dipeptide repeats protein [Quillaja saponaria]|uniref:Arginine-glutamic acid dipeptide repeats protein n=1 Tax=Quillaja saponaria TaxID=32244 RepID=A0AAD7QF75_QUISA|nr:Arginine-glutamic acid dipeptide repeats protein [Quillaja saponaria]
MEIDGVQVSDTGNFNEKRSHDQSVSPENSNMYNVFGDPEISPRVGEQYQAKLPPLLTEAEYYLLRKNPTVEEITAGGPHDFLVGLPIPIMLIDDELKNIKHEALEAGCNSIEVPNKIDSSQPECIRGTQVFLTCNNLNTKVGPLDSTLVTETNLGESASLIVKQEAKTEMKKKHRGKCHCLVPGSFSNSWNDIEEAGFILGLYIFGKNLVQVRRFIGCKNMGDILSFYYGRFYRSEKYCRWGECRKMRSRKCIYGQKIFTGARQQELLSRLVLYVSEEYRNTLLEVSKIFGEGKLLLEEYVSTLKALVGLNALVEAVAIGKGKQDLTGINVEATKPSQVLPARLEIPVGKACSLLTPQEITNFLTGDFRLSKARSNDLFWEAVWPRLLARGWHSEQPNSHGYATSSKLSLVFLVPGVKKFSRRKLMKGTHFFDSISDVLSKVASDPGLLELDTAVANDYGSKNENGWTTGTKLDQETFPDQQRHCYLKPQTPNHSVDVMKFTVVDTSGTSGKASKMRQMRNFPRGVMKASVSESHCEDDEDTAEEEKQEHDSFCHNTDEMISKTTNVSIGTGVFSNSNGLENKALKEMLPISRSDSTDLFANISKNMKTDNCNETMSRNAKKCLSSKKEGPGGKNLLGPVTKRRRRLTACNLAETNCVTANILVPSIGKQEEASCCRENLISSDKVHTQSDPSQQNKSTSSPPSIASPNFTREAITNSNHFCIEQHEKPQSRILIDLNLPFTPDAEADEPFMTEMTERRQPDSTSKESDNSHSGTISKCVDNSQHQPDVNPRRHSTRNRPPTTKVLESLACGFWDKKEKRKSREVFHRDNSAFRPSRRTCGKARGEASGSGGANFQGDDRENSV